MEHTPDCERETSMTDKHTPGPCGCHLDPVDDRLEASDLCSEASGALNGVGWKIVYCHTHAAAPELLEALERITAAIEHNQIAAATLLAEKARTAIKAARKS